ncbi:Homocitrate dehydratase, mitochondrial [Neolecta irregularis DAH-3]|uniref:Large ribosomal subunit protein bL21m n=1 Tax=Neolecta irregularis (strain DAH-3) TaxID=1198029 RepID=A0A1U7LWR8_NEOID|nr:Homocitrate dehydratase, mitochondrial [Neolecta irregularis DAH-3]|eukprot:OLL27125.1 Homocitrate dehydratase, mitochondrial [Neolecta irregularis DAH-3]
MSKSIKEIVRNGFNYTATYLKNIFTSIGGLKSQPNHYAVLHIHDRPYLLTENDQLTVPFNMKPLHRPGQIIRLTHCSKLGSRDFTIQGNPWIDNKLFTARAVVLEITKGPMFEKILDRRRQRHKKRVTSKHYQTVLRICELKIADELETSGSN